MNNTGRKEGNELAEKTEKGEGEPEYPRSVFFLFLQGKNK